MFEIKGKTASAFVTIDDIEQSVISQLYSVVNHPAASGRIVIMPDCHAGKGCVIGFTMKMGDKIVPNWVGVDIGCGMRSVKIDVKKLSHDDLLNIDKKIKENIPMGMNVNSRHLSGIYETLEEATRQDVRSLVKKIGMKEDRFLSSISSLGGGNHMGEAGVDEEGNIWFTVHTGSRNFGKRVCEYFDEIARKKLVAKEDFSGCISELKERASRGEVNKKDISKLLEEAKRNVKRDFDIKVSAYLEGSDVEDYMNAMVVAQAYADLNRHAIIDEIVRIVSKVTNRKVKVLDEIDTIHNYIDPVTRIIRKGAVSARAGERLVIPLNMRDGVLVCEGLSNEDWNCSAPHGAGRVMSRAKAKESITLTEFKSSMEGITTTSVSRDTIDESPMAYKDSLMIENAIAPTVKIINRIKPIYNVKAGGE